MASQNIARLGVVLGLDTAEFTASIDQAISANKKLKDAIRRETNAAQKELTSLKYATEDYGKVVSKVTMVEREMSAGRFKNATADVKKQLLDQAKAYDAIAASAKNAAGAQFKMNEQQKIQLTYQTTDLFTQIASGQSPFIAILQQGGQLKDVMGGIGNMFRAIGTLFTPFSVGLGAVAVGLGTMAVAAYQAKDELDKLRDALTLTGQFSGVTEESFLSLSKTLSEQTSASIGKTKDALMAVVSSGQFSGKSLEAVTKAIITYSEIAGVPAKEAADKLKGGLNGTAEGAKSLNKEMNFLTLQQYKQIEALEKANKKQEAAQLVAIALNTKLEQQRRELGILEGAWKNVTKAVSSYYDKLKGLLSGPTQSETLESLDKQIDSVKKKLADVPEGKDTFFTRGWRKTLAALEAAKENILEIQRLQNRSTTSKDVGNAKEEIEEYDKYKGMLRSKAFEVAKAQNDAQLAAAKIGAGEIEDLQLEAMKKLADARIEMAQKNREEDGRATAQNLEIYKQKAIVIATETAEKIKQIRNKYAIAQFNDELAATEEFNLAWAIEDNRIRAMRKIEQDRTIDMDFQRESLELKYQMIYATEREQKLAQISLDYARRRRNVEGQDSDILKELDRQEQLAKMFVVIQESAKRTQQVFDSVFGNLTSAIDNFVKTGKLSMKDLTRSIIQDLIAIQMKAAILRFLGGAFGNLSAAATYGTIPGSQQTNMLAAQEAGFQKRANGGPVSGGAPYIVGERGPEMFVPSGSGTIIPNHNMGTQSVNNVTNNYINAIDVKSFETRLLESSNTIWAGYQYANKQLASNGRRA